jgi:hypothetical protein
MVEILKSNCYLKLLDNRLLKYYESKDIHNP